MGLDFSIGAAPAVTRNGGPRRRSETQQEYDKLVGQLYNAWADAGSPTKASDKPAAYIPIAPLPNGEVDAEAVKAAEKALRSAADHENASVRFYGYEAARKGDKKGTVYVIVSAEAKRTYKKNAPTTES